jgi:predicted naringenin-chalcone synthase
LRTSRPTREPLGVLLAMGPGFSTEMVLTQR